MTAVTPVKPGDRVFVAGVQHSTPGELEVHDVVATVTHVAAQSCGCWRVTCARPGEGGWNRSFQVYGASCVRRHDDVIDYSDAIAEAARREAEPGALFPAPTPRRRVLVPVPELDPAPRVRTLTTVGGVL